jgi:hypothetical protein
MSTGCSLSPGSYRSFDQWTVGSPSRDYDDFGAESVPGVRRIYGPILAGPYMVRDAVRIAMSPFAFVYYELGGEEDEGERKLAPYWDEDLP